MKKRWMFVFGVALFVLLSGCAENNKIDNSDSWKKDVLFASECGMDGLQCCLGEDELCKFGQSCCFDPSNNKNTYCADTCAPGTLDNFCNADSECDEGLACKDSYCVHAGALDEPCLGGAECEEGLVCYKNNCVECGKENNPCCVQSFCDEQEEAASTRLDCIEGVCLSCGGDSKTACLSEPACNEGNLLNNSTCLSCGDIGKPCCSDGNENFCNDALDCNLGFCE